MTDSTQPIILITGSRKWSDDAFIHDALAAQNPALVVAGAAAGADRIAAKWCHANGVGLIEVPALWDSEGKAAGPKRNARMLKVAQLLAEGASRPLVVLAFPTVESKGTFNMIALCQKKGIEVQVQTSPSTIAPTPGRVRKQRVSHYPPKDGPVPEGTIYVGRPSPWGNPYKVGDGIDAKEAVRLFRRYMEDRRFREPYWMLPLQKADALACACKPGEPCHVDALLDYL